jgi:hypothetical protein
MPTSEQQSEELSVFRAFAEVCPLEINIESIRSEDPPLPDVSCLLADGSKYAFELVEAKDVTADRQFSGNLIPVQKYKSEEKRVRSALRNEFERACANKEIDDPKRFDGYHLNVNFADSANTKSRLNIVTTVIQTLNERGPGGHVVQHPLIRWISCMPNLENQSGLQFCEHSYASNAQASVVGSIKQKLRKLRDGQYDAEHPILLLVWSDARVIDDCFEWYENARELIAKCGQQFTDVWIYQSYKRRCMKL